MVHTDYHKEKVEIEKGRIKREEIATLEGRMILHGWTNLKWCPGHPEDREIRWKLYGRPPNYQGKYEDYLEPIIFTLAIPGKPYEDSGEILIRNNFGGIMN